jgi:cytochrome c
MKWHGACIFYEASPIYAAFRLIQADSSLSMRSGRDIALGMASGFSIATVKSIHEYPALVLVFLLSGKPVLHCEGCVRAFRQWTSLRRIAGRQRFGAFRLVASVRRRSAMQPVRVDQAMTGPVRLVASRLCLLFLSLLATACGDKASTMHVAGGDPERGKETIQRYGCIACHTIPGMAGHGSNVGPPLAKMGLRAYVGGVLPNTPDDLVRWLRNPPAVDPRTAMPNLGISEAEAKDIAAYLYTLK